MKTKIGTLKDQRTNAELGLIIDEMGRAMWNANREYVARRPGCQHDDGINFTPHMRDVWSNYILFCRNNPQ